MMKMTTMWAVTQRNPSQSEPAAVRGIEMTFDDEPRAYDAPPMSRGRWRPRPARVDLAAHFGS